MLAFSVVTGLVMASAGSASAGLFTYGNPAFCAPTKPVRDFGFAKLPPVREVPESASGLGHGAVDVYGGWSRVMPRPAPFGYGFSEHSYTDRGVLLNWTVTAQLWIFDRYGTVFREVDHEKLFIGRLHAAHQPSIYVDPLNDRRGLYRFDMQIADRGREVLGSYSAYFKVVRPFWRAELQLSRDTVRPGERILIRIENYGSETVSYGEPFGVQRFDDGHWVPVPDLTRHRWLKWLGFLGPGGIGRCGSLSLPTDTALGRYRIVKGVGTSIAPEGKHVQLIAQFDVVDSGAEY